jgi:hypothetical protein
VVAVLGGGAAYDGGITEEGNGVGGPSSWIWEGQHDDGVLKIKQQWPARAPPW